MINELSFKTAVCERNEQLLKLSHAKYATWEAKRKEVDGRGMNLKELSGELLRLQADYANSYRDLQRHFHN